MLETAAEVIGIGISECGVTGERLNTDFRMALDAGMTSTVVLTGEVPPQMLGAAGEIRPNYVLDGTDRLMPPWGWRELGWTDED